MFHFFTLSHMFAIHMSVFQWKQGNLPIDIDGPNPAPLEMQKTLEILQDVASSEKARLVNHDHMQPEPTICLQSVFLHVRTNTFAHI